jgi:hypothetical protein
VDVASCQASNSDVWFVFTPLASGDYTFSTNTPAGFTAGTLTNTVLSVYASCPAGAELGCDNDNGAGSRSTVRVNGLVGGLAYYVRVADQATSVATGTFYVSVMAAVTNDECAGAIPLALGVNPAPGASGNLFTNEGATTSAGVVPSCPAPTTGSNSDVWFSFTPSGNGTYVFSTDTPSGFVSGSLTDTALSVWDSCGPAMVELACDDDGGTTGALLSVATVTGLVAGQTYYVRVADYSGTTIDQGSFYLSVTPKFELAFSAPFGPGSIQADLTNGPYNGLYYFAVSLNAGAYPNGYFFGIDIDLQEVVNQINIGFPFTGPLSAGGSMTIGPAAGLPSGLTIYSVGLGFVGTLGVPTASTGPRSFMVP